MRLALSTLSLLWALPAASLAAGETAPAPSAAAPAPVVAPVPAKEVIDTADAPAAAVPVAAAPDTGTVAKTDSAAPASAAQEPVPLEIRNAYLAHLDLTGTVQLKAFYHNFAAEKDADKRLSFQLRRFEFGLEASFNTHSGFKGVMLLDGANKNFGVNDAYLYYRVNDLVGFKGGKMRRPFSQESLQSARALYTIERGELYFDFLANTTGYAYYDLGALAYGGFEEDGMSLGYELGVFNGKQNDDAAKDYSGQQDEKTDKGFKAKDVVFRVNASPFKALKVEGAVSTKAAENVSNPADFGYAVNTAYQLGADFHYDKLRLLGEAAWGDNHKKQDSKIIDGSVLFFTFYTAAVWREDYSRGRASELVLKMEGLDPDFEPGTGEGAPNDGKLRYTLGCNYFFTPTISIMADYAALQPITKVAGEDKLTHDFDVMWRMSF